MKYETNRIISSGISIRLATANKLTAKILFPTILHVPFTTSWRRYRRIMDRMA